MMNTSLLKNRLNRPSFILLFNNLFERIIPNNRKAFTTLIHRTRVSSLFEKTSYGKQHKNKAFRTSTQTTLHHDLNTTDVDMDQRQKFINGKNNTGGKIL